VPEISNKSENTLPATQDGFVKLPDSRHFIIDFLYFAKKVPSQPAERTGNFLELDQLRKGTNYRIGWAAIFTRAYAVMANRHPVLRQRICEWPWMRLYQKPEQEAKICVSREYKGEKWLFFFGINKPEGKSLTEIQQELIRASTAPIDTIPAFARQTKYHRVPRFIRRLYWRLALNFPNLCCDAAKGTFGLTSTAPWNATIIHPPSAGHIVLTYSPMDEQGDMQFTLVYDHRIFDGATAAQFLAELEDVLQNQIKNELELLRNRQLSGNMNQIPPTLKMR